MSALEGSDREKPIDFTEDVRSKSKKWFLATYEIFLSVLHVSITIILVTLGDVLVVAVITWALGDPASQSILAKKFLEGIKILSIFGVSATYTIYLVYSLLQDVKHVRKLTQEDNK